MQFSPAPPQLPCDDLVWPSSHSTSHPFTSQPSNGREVQKSHTAHLSQSRLYFLCSILRILRPLRKSLKTGNSLKAQQEGESEVAHSSALGELNAVMATSVLSKAMAKDLFIPFSGAHRHTGTPFTFKSCFIIRHLMGRFHFYYLIRGPKVLGCQMPEV